MHADSNNVKAHFFMVVFSVNNYLNTPQRVPTIELMVVKVFL